MDGEVFQHEVQSLRSVCVPLYAEGIYLFRVGRIVGDRNGSSAIIVSFTRTIDTSILRRTSHPFEWKAETRIF